MLRARGRIRGRRADGSDPGAAPRATSRSRHRGPRRPPSRSSSRSGSSGTAASDRHSDAGSHGSRGQGHARRDETGGFTGAPGAHGRRGAARRPAARTSGCATRHARLRPGTGDRGAVALRGRARCGGGGGGCDCVRRRSRCAFRSRTRLGARRVAPRGSSSARAGLAARGEQMRRHERRVDHELSRSGGEPGTALRSPLLQQRPARAGLHAVAKPVLLVAPAIVGLERALHAWPPRAPGRRADDGARRPGAAAQTTQSTRRREASGNQVRASNAVRDLARASLSSQCRRLVAPEGR